MMLADALILDGACSFTAIPVKRKGFQLTKAQKELDEIQ